MKWRELIEEVAERTNQPRAVVLAILRAMAKTSQHALASGEDVVIRGVGTILTSWRGPRTMRSVTTGEQVYLDGRRDAAVLAKVPGRLQGFHRLWAAGYRNIPAEHERHEDRGPAEAAPHTHIVETDDQVRSNRRSLNCCRKAKYSPGRSAPVRLAQRRVSANASSRNAQT